MAKLGDCGEVAGENDHCKVAGIGGGGRSAMTPATSIHS